MFSVIGVAMIGNATRRFMLRIFLFIDEHKKLRGESHKYDFYIYNDIDNSVHCISDFQLIDWLFLRNIKINGVTLSTSVENQICVESGVLNFDNIVKLLSAEDFVKQRGTFNPYMFDRLGYGAIVETVKMVKVGSKQYVISRNNLCSYNNSFITTKYKYLSSMVIIDKNLVCTLDESDGSLCSYGLFDSALIRCVYHILLQKVYGTEDITGVSLESNILTIDTLAGRYVYEVDKDYLAKLCKNKLLGNFAM